MLRARKTSGQDSDAVEFLEDVRCFRPTFTKVIQIQLRTPDAHRIRGVALSKHESDFVISCNFTQVGWRCARMRLVVFGLTISSSWGNGHATIWRALCRALTRLGHHVTFFEKDAPYYANHRDLRCPQRYDLILYQQWAEVAPAAATAIANSDAAMVTSFCPDAAAACDLVLDCPSTLRVYYDLDSPVTLDRLREQGTVDYLPPYGLEPFDLVLSYAGGRALDELTQRLGARRVAALYGSADPDLYQHVQPSEHYRSDVSYLGTFSKDRQATLDQLFLEPARRLPTKRFLIGGAMYPDDFPWSENVWFVHHVPPPEHPAFYSSSQLTLSVTRGPMAELGYCPSGRIFEAAACQTPLISDEWSGLSTFFEPGREILLARQASDVTDALNLGAEELQKVGSAARERVLAEHTATHRARQLLRYLEMAG
jgi:spore maturation protein CgeB